MAHTYVFDFYNLYIPKGKCYSNEELGIKIIPLKFAEEFEKNRHSFSKPHHRGGWKTAKCFIKAKDEEHAKKLAGWIEFLYSFAQSRSVFFLGWYKYKKGKKYSSFHSKFIEPRENRFSELLHGVHTKGAFYTRDISPFISDALKTLNNAKSDELNSILTTIHAHIISHSELQSELQFLACWIALEKLANKNYSELGSKKLFSKNDKEELKELKEAIKQTLKENIEDSKKFNIISRNLSSNYLYEHDTSGKLLIYLSRVDVGLDQNKLKSILNNKLLPIRRSLVHHLESDLLKKEPQLLFYLQMIMENVIFRLLGINKQMQNKFILNQYNRGKL